MSIRFAKLWETDNERNYILNDAPNKNDGNPAPRNRLYVVSEGDEDELDLTLALDVEGVTLERVLWAIYDGGEKVLEGAMPADGSPAPIRFAQRGSAKRYDLRAGVDLDEPGEPGHGVLDPHEWVPLAGDPHVQGFNKADYLFAKQEVVERILSWFPRFGG